MFRFAESQELRFQASKLSIMFSAVLDGGRSADIHEICFQAAKRSDMDCMELQGDLFAESQEWHIPVNKLSDNCNAFLEDIRFPDVHE